jgi:hypothetical protein
MVWIVIVISAGLAGFAFGWISFQKTRERVIISFEMAKIAPAVEKLKLAAARMRTRGRHFFERSRHS